MTDGAQGQVAAGRMHKRRAALEDGRYLIYYTFDEDGGESLTGDESRAARPEPVAENVAEEERSV